MTERPVVSVDARVAEIERREQAATPGEWFFTGYSQVQSAPKVIPHDEFWSDERVNDGHTYEHHAGVTCPSCGERWYLVNGKRRGRVWDCARAPEALDMEPTVAYVTASYGDTATGQRVADAEFIAHAREDIPWLLSQLRDARAENERLQGDVRRQTERANAVELIESRGRGLAQDRAGRAEAALAAVVQAVEAEIAHAEFNEHRLAGPGVAPGEHVPAVRVSHLRAALAAAEQGEPKQENICQGCGRQMIGSPPACDPVACPGPASQPTEGSGK